MEQSSQESIKRTVIATREGKDSEVLNPLTVSEIVTEIAGHVTPSTAVILETVCRSARFGVLRRLLHRWRRAGKNAPLMRVFHIYHKQRAIENMASDAFYAGHDAVFVWALDLYKTRWTKKTQEAFLNRDLSPRDAVSLDSGMAMIQTLETLPWFSAWKQRRLHIQILAKAGRMDLLEVAYADPTWTNRQRADVMTALELAAALNRANVVSWHIRNAGVVKNDMHPNSHGKYRFRVATAAIAKAVEFGSIDVLESIHRIYPAVYAKMHSAARPICFERMTASAYRWFKARAKKMCETCWKNAALLSQQMDVFDEVKVTTDTWLISSWLFRFLPQSPRDITWRHALLAEITEEFLDYLWNLQWTVSIDAVGKQVGTTAALFRFWHATEPEKLKVEQAIRLVTELTPEFLDWIVEIGYSHDEVATHLRDMIVSLNSHAASKRDERAQHRIMVAIEWIAQRGTRVGLDDVLANVPSTFVNALWHTAAKTTLIEL